MDKEKITVKDIIEATGGRLIQNGYEYFYEVTTDSRNIPLDSLFVPLSGEKFNGHKFISSIWEKGAGGTLVQVSEEYELVKMVSGKTYQRIRKLN